MSTKFDLKKVYTHEWTKEKLIEFISHCYDKKFKVVILPTTKTSADILIQDIRKEAVNLKELELKEYIPNLDKSKDLCVLMGCENTIKQSLGEVIKDKTNTPEVISQAKLQLELGFKKEYHFCQECFWK